MNRDVSRSFYKDAGKTTALYFAWSALGLVVIGLAYTMLRSWLNVPFGFSEPWTSHGSVIDGLGSVWFIFVWGAGLALLGGLLRIVRRTPRANEPGEIFIEGTWISFNAGFFEEIIYRWLALFGSMIVLKILNVITFGFIKWLYMSILVPFTNWVSFDLLEPQLYGNYGWLFAAGIVSASFRFSSGHEYQGTLGVINSWYIGLFMFFLMFHYGLWVAIIAHILYDLSIFWIRSAAAYLQPRNHGRELFAHLLPRLR